MDDILTSKGRCVSCAFLAKRVIDKSGRFVSPRYYEIDEDGRITGAVWKSLADPLIGQIDSMPFCFVRAVQLHTEIARRIGIEDKVQATREVFRADRNCQSWQRYNAGYGPKEQHEQLNMERVVEQAGKAFERHMEKATKEFEMKLSAFSEQVHVSNKTIVKRFTIGAIILLFFQVWLVLGQSQNLSPNLKLQMSRLVGSITEIFSRKAE